MSTLIVDLTKYRLDKAFSICDKADPLILDYVRSNQSDFSEIVSLPLDNVPENLDDIAWALDVLERHGKENG